MKQDAWKRICSCILAFAMILGMCTWNIGSEPIKVEASEAGTAETAATLSNPRKDSNGNVTYDCVWFGRYPQSDATGKKKDPIKWRVLSVKGNDAFLVADCNLDCQTYNTTYESVTWETCTLRSWLNGYNAGYNLNRIDYSSNNFIDKAFTSAEQNAINQVTVVNNDNPDYGTEGGNTTKDKIFLLSIEEVINPDYGFISDSWEYDKARHRKNTAYIANGGTMDLIETNEGSNGDWWLRTPGAYAGFAADVDDNGHVYTHGDGVSMDYNIHGACAICPAMHLNLSSNLWSYAGTVCTDGTVKTNPLSNPRKDGNGNVTYDCVWFGRYPQSDATGNKKDPIKWRVLSVKGNDAFLVADCNLDCEPYNITYSDVTWETCTLRSWLNGYNASCNSKRIDYSSNNFIDKAFTSAEQNAINQVTVVSSKNFIDEAFTSTVQNTINQVTVLNNDNTDSGTEGGNNTKDKVFLLSIEEMTNPDYGFSSDSWEYDKARHRKNTAYAKEQGAWTSSTSMGDKYNDNGLWWLRSSGYAECAAYVDEGGNVETFGNNVDHFNYHAVCPALHLNLSSNLWSYAGTVQTNPKAKTPAKKGTTLTVSKNNIKVKVTSASKSNPTVAVTKVANSSAKKVTIPSTVMVDGITYKVTKIADNAFKGNKKLTTVTIGSNVTSIGKNAFFGCTSLTKVTIGKNVTTIGDKAFCKCTKLKGITIPSKVKKIGSSAFSGCTSLTKVTIGKNVTTIGDKAFYKCTKLKGVTIPDKVKKIGNSALYGCTSLTKVTIGKGVTSIGKNAFYGCKKLKTITIKSSKVKMIGKNAFKGINKKVSFTLKGTKSAKKALKKKLKKTSVGYIKTWKFK